MNTFAPFFEDPLARQITFWTVLVLIAGFALTTNLRAAITYGLAAAIAAVALLVGLQISSPLLTGTMIGAVGLICILPPTRADLRIAGGLFFALTLGLYAWALTVGKPAPGVEELVEWVVFVALALTTVGSAVAMVSSRSAVYSAIWFALALLSTGGLFLYQGAQFLGVATVTVYAGAIVVTFLFVIMLAQPGGHSIYDRLSWGWFAKPAAALASALLMGVILFALESMGDAGLRERVQLAAREVAAESPTGERSMVLRDEDLVAARREETSGTIVYLTLAENAATPAESDLAALAAVLEVDEVRLAPQRLPALLDPRAPDHMARLGGYLFSRHLLAVEVAGTLLLAALVGAIAMLSQGPAANREGDAHV